MPEARLAADVIIVGAGPAGSSLATWLGRQGHTVLVLDRAHFPRDKVCGECLSPGALALLEDLGAAQALLEAGARPYRGLRLVAADGAQAEAPYPDGARGYSLSRVALDALLLAGARRTPGVRVLEGAAVKALVYAGDAVAGVRLADGREAHARLVVGADGRFSTIRRLAFGQEPTPPCDRFCFVTTFEDARGGDDWLTCELAAPGLQALHIDQGGGAVSVCLVVDGATRDRHGVGTLAGFERLVHALPRLTAVLGPAAHPATPLKGMPLTRYQPRTLVRDGLALVGDAVGFMDPITGEGMCRALHASRLAADAIGQALQAAPGAVLATALRAYPARLAAQFDPVVAFVEVAVRLTTLPSPVASFLVRGLGRLPALAGAVAATQGALLSPLELALPWAWPAARPGRFARAVLAPHPDPTPQPAGAR